ncbi:hypothetical protein BH10ACI2_BH10ACI2_15130 [soil metagenome]
MTEELKDLQREYNQLAQYIKPCDTEYSFLTERQDDGSPHVEFANGEFHYVVTERGSEFERRTTDDINEILYWLVNDLTFWMSVEYELKHRMPGQDFRRVMFDHRIEIMKKARREFADRLEGEIAETLSNNPFLD